MDNKAIRREVEALRERLNSVERERSTVYENLQSSERSFSTEKADLVGAFEALKVDADGLRKQLSMLASDHQDLQEKYRAATSEHLRYVCVSCSQPFSLLHFPSFLRSRVICVIQRIRFGCPCHQGSRGAETPPHCGFGAQPAGRRAGLCAVRASEV